MKFNRKNFQNLSNKERAEIYADMKVHNELYLQTGPSFLKKIHESRFNSIRKLLGDVSNKKILDAGAGEGYFLSSIKAKQKVGIELSEKRCQKAKNMFPDLDIKVGDIKNMPFEDNSFDIIICSEVLEHVTDFEKAILELKRCINHTGFIVLSFPNEFTVSLGRLLILKFPMREIDHINSIKPKDIEKLLGKKYESSNVPNVKYPFCLYQIYKFESVNFKND